MRNCSIDIDRSLVVEHFCCAGESACGFCNVVNEKDIFAFDIADDVKGFDFGGAGASFDDDGHVRIEGLGVGGGHFDTSDIWGDDDEVVELEGADVVDKNGEGVEVVNRNIEKPLELLGVQVHGKDTGNASGDEEIGNEFGGDGDAGLVFAVLPGVAEKGDNCRDAGCASAAGGIDHDEEFHQVLVRGRAGGLDDEDIAAADIFVDSD